MKQEKQGRIIATGLPVPDSHFLETMGIYTIAHLSLGYGSWDAEKGDTEVGYYKTISSYTTAAREEGSRVFILGFGLRSVPAS